MGRDFRRVFKTVSTDTAWGLVVRYLIKVEERPSRIAPQKPNPMRLKFWESRQTLTDADLPTMLKILYNRGDIDMEFYEILNETCESIEELAWIMNKTEQYATA